MAWSYEIKFGQTIVGLSSRSFPTSKEAEIDAELLIQKMSLISGSLYTYRVFLSDLIL